MNEHFRPPGNAEGPHEAPLWTVPRRGYGRVDHVELDPQRSSMVLVAIDLVDGDWFDAQAQLDDRFLVQDSARRASAWRRFKHELSKKATIRNPFEKAPIFRLEIELPRYASWFGLPPLPPRWGQSYDAVLAQLESQWIEFDHISRASDMSQPGTGLLYPGLFSEPVPVLAQGRIPSAQQGLALIDIFSLAHLPEADVSDVELALATARADFLAVYDVGQGNANALLSKGRRASLYFDLGAGVYRNRRTTPSGLRFCLSGHPTIILSHWDADHWAGACATLVAGSYPAIAEQWIAPLQVVGPVHIAFAYDIVTNGGTLHTYSATSKAVISATAVSGQTISFTMGSGATRNSSGIVLAVENRTLPAGPGSWLLTGDCDYKYFLSSLLPEPSIAIVVPHHGADLYPSLLLGPTTAQTYRRIIYSFGKDNAHGKTNVQHPTLGGVNDHIGAGWDHGMWSTLPPMLGSVQPGGEVLATCEHSPGAFRGGALVGWSTAPVPLGLPCGGAYCSASLIQS